jgi:glycosyltransferase involved in cell wall biosynthesis
MKKSLAIVIPAYKTNYLNETLESIANQTCQDFTLYIGDDASPFEVLSIVRKFEDRIRIVYRRFTENLGGRDLAGQWNRCLDLAGDEEWLWLFSDDDIMQPNCVDLFYQTISNDDKSALLHFSVRIVDKTGEQLVAEVPFPESQSALDFYRKRMRGEIYSFAVEYIFRKALYNSKSKFESFDLAWNSDDATWIKFAEESRIRTINGASVQWRLSDSNISSMTGNVDLVKRKIEASVTFLRWSDNFWAVRSIRTEVSNFQKFKVKVLTPIAFSRCSFFEKYEMSINALLKLNYANRRKLTLLTCLFLVYMEIKLWFTNKKF